MKKPRKNKALTCYKSISVARLIRELAKLPPTQKVALTVRGRVYQFSRDGLVIERSGDGNFLIATG